MVILNNYYFFSSHWKEKEKKSIQQLSFFNDYFCSVDFSLFLLFIIVVCNSFCSRKNKIFVITPACLYFFKPSHNKIITETKIVKEC